jgi:DNA-binding NarL/FixJ family response regulator
METEVIGVGVVDDDPDLRQALKLLFDVTPGFRCVGVWASAEEALRLASRARPQVVLLDVNLPGRSGAEAVGDLVAILGDVPVLMLTVQEDDEKIFESLCRGASGYLLKRTTPGRLLHAVKEAHGGGAPLSPEIARKALRFFQRFPPPEASDAVLNDQEKRFLALLAEGATYQGAADRMGVSINTVRNYVRSVYRKLQVSSRSAAVSRALKSGLI